MTRADNSAERGDAHAVSASGGVASALPFSLAVGHHASDEVLASVQRVTGLKSNLVDAQMAGSSALRMASDPTVPSYDDPQPDPPTVPSYDTAQPDPPTVPSADS